ncbi:molybdate ABC transporter permease subunit [Halopseudomonas nanhaiensis]|uniref:molybdate ABC transporter permease subunit n=1 Tax=Halopseudomonas nanhaiensis TaxID=2830842 RepID=UPI001CC0F92F|nr:molybdate ABC transporter permease subunit [Halopseudomonas nanhaiensis]UAW99999.1 molybdate ABC transporter permease subunit [Halopseudomonas nanhaiensis]
MTLSPADWLAIRVTLKLCLYTTLLLMLLATPLALWLAAGTSRLRSLVQALVALPLVLPPTVLGFYLLLMLGPHGWIGRTLESIGLTHLAFSFEGILIGSVIYSLPFAVQPLQQAFRQMGRRPHEVAASLGAGPLDRFLSITLPLARNGFIIAATLTFAHTLGEFGVILMIGGSIPGETHVLSTTIYSHAEAMNYPAAHRLSLLLLGCAFAVLSVIYLAGNRKPPVVQP